MDILYSKSAAIFVGILFILVLADMFPTQLFILLSILIGSLLVIYQAVIILKDDSGKLE